MTILEKKQLEYQRYFENPEFNGLRYGSSLMRGQVLLEMNCVFLEHEFELGILPKTLRETVFDLTQEEWNASFVLLLQAKALLESKLHPDGWNVGWNVAPVGGLERTNRAFASIASFCQSAFCWAWDSLVD